jgi:putative membrane protein
MIVLRTSLIALSMLAVSACSSETERDAAQTVDNAESAVENAAAATGDALGNVGQGLMPTPTGQEFADRAAKSDAFEIAAARLAESNAQSPQVKAFAKMMIEAHTDSTAKIKAAAAAAQPAITPDATMTRDQEEDLTELKALKGAGFDEEYMDGQVDAHEDALDLMRKYAADGTVASLKTAAGEIAPVVEKHLAEARTLDKD